MSSVIPKRPRFLEEDAARIGRELWGVDGSARELPSERDQNFQLTGRDASFVLKLSGPLERRETLDLQNAALEWLASRAPEVPLPRARPSASGLSTVSVPGPDGSPRLARLLTYLPGRALAQASPHSPRLLANIGRFLGELDRALEGFAHPAAADRDLDWNPERALAVIDRNLPAIGDRRRRDLVAHFVRLWEATLPRLEKHLPRSVIHNDANDWNVLVGDPTPIEDRPVAGLLDFGDMLETWTACEVAVAIAYAMLGKEDPVSAAAALVRGYHQVRPLGEDELTALFSLAAIRLCVSVCLSAHRRSAEPENTYLTISEAPAWKALGRLREVPPRLAEYVFRDACGLAPCPMAPRVEAWLSEHRDAIGPVVEADLSKSVVVDLSVGSLELESPAAAADTAALTAKIFGKMREAGVEVAVGRYDEARLVYQTDAFRGPDGEHPEWRTVHLAVDLFLPPGSPVLAPLAGRVHSTRDNAARLDYGPTVVLEHAAAEVPFYTLYGHLTADSLAGLSPGASVEKGQTIGRIGAPPGNGDWPPHVHFQIVTDLLGREGDFPGVAPASQRAVWLSLSPDPSLLLGVSVRAPETDPKTLSFRRSRRLGSALSVSYREPLHIVRGDGAFLYDNTGRAYLDVVNNVAHVGHCHPRVVGAASRQIAVLNTNTRYLHASILRYAERLRDALPEPLSVLFFVCSGSEANELALRMARAHTKGRDVIVVDGAYHGNTSALIEVSPYKFDGPGGEGAPAHVHKVPMPDDYRGLYRREDTGRGEKFARHVAEAAEEARARGGKPAAFLCESLLSCGGQIVPPPGFLAAAYRHARRAGAVCIADEVQVGFGRVGTHFWGFQTQDVVPDIVTMGKPIGNGHPLAAVATTAEVADSFANGMEYFNTFGGNPVSCEIGLAVLDVIQQERLQERALSVGETFRAGLEKLRQRHAIVGDVRGLGLFLGIELVRDRATLEPAAEEAAYVVERMKDHGILLSTDGPFHNVIKMKPPMVFSEADAERVVAAYDRVLGEDFVLGPLRD